ncbi:hypothetical protein HC891_15115 [Candidatus Gracilibacteria bacterium]|nr:hypothetical protein [Candidatus Gracilibacteria bacterium]
MERLQPEGARTKEYLRTLLTAFGQPFDFHPAFPSRQPLVEPLSGREVLRLIATWLSNQGLAAQLILSLHTSKVHTRNIYGKLGVTSRTQAVAGGCVLGLLELS